MPADAGASESVERRLRQAGVPGQAGIVVIHVSAGNPFRRWPAAHFAEVAAALASDDPTKRIIITSGPSERGAADAIAIDAQARAGKAADRILRCGEFDLAELRVLVARASLYVGGDSGPLHIAGTTETPIVAIYGPTLPARSHPWRDPRFVSEAVEPGPLSCRPCDQRACIPNDFRCLTQTTAEQVTSAAERALARAHELRQDRSDLRRAAAAGGRP
jgi:ADP-heptose:LPS heptosyltransferase